MTIATKKSKSNKKAPKAVSPIVKLNAEVLKTTEELIEGTIVTGEKWQELYAKSLRKSEPIISKNINLAFDTVETVVEQYQTTSKRILKLFGWDVKDMKVAANKAMARAADTTKPITIKAGSVAKKAAKTAQNLGAKANDKVKDAAKVVANVTSDVEAIATGTSDQIKDTTIKNSVAAQKASNQLKDTMAKTVASTAKKVIESSPIKNMENLKLINGIGPKMEELLKKEGYTTLEAVANASVEDLKKVLDNADPRYRLLNPESWIIDAKASLS